MRTKYLLSLAVAVCAAAQPAQAVDFTFSFTSDGDPRTSGTIPGSVTGRILGLADNATGAAGAVYIDTFPGAVGPSTNAAAWVYQAGNSFTVSGGVITAAVFGAEDYSPSHTDKLYIDFYSPFYDGSYNYASLGNFNVQRIWNFGGLPGVTFARTAAAPEPSTWAMMIVGFGAIGMGMRSRRTLSPLPKKTGTQGCLFRYGSS